jgi:Cupin domain
VLEDVSPPHHGPPLHKHDFEEFFYILSGEFLFELDGKQLRDRVQIATVTFAMDRISVLEFISRGPKTRQEILDGGMVYNTRFRLLVDELERQGLVRYSD